MMAQRRRKIPEDVAADLRFEVDLRCCLCEYRDALPPRTDSGQIHHLDGDPGNNDPRNLVWLCLDHHEEAGRVGRVARRLSPKTIDRFRTELVRRIRRRRSEEKDRKHVHEGVFSAALDATVALDVAKHRAHANKGWEEASEVLTLIAYYPDSMGYEGRRAILEFLEHLASRTRFHMTDGVAHQISNIVIGVLPLGYLRTSDGSRVTASDVALLDLALQIGEALAYDGALKLGKLQIAEQGCDILWRALSFAVIHRHRRLRERANRAFDTALDGASRSNLPEAVTMVEFAKRHGAAGEVGIPDYPDEVIFAL